MESKPPEAAESNERPTARRRYDAPKVTVEEVFERRAQLACGKTSADTYPGGPCYRKPISS